MATGYLELFPGGCAPDGSGTINNAAALSYEVSTGTQTANTPKATQLKLLFDAATDEHWMFAFQIPGDYASGGTLRGTFKMTSATASDVIWKGGQASSVNSSTAQGAIVFAAGDLATAVTVPGTAGHTIGFTITLTTTNMAVNRHMELFIGRDADNAGDTATGDAELLSLNFEYTTT
jgi:hypothetical protein